jgi:hypothetical protein
MCLCSVFALFGWQSPQPCADIFAAGALQIIGVRNLHQVRQAPVQVFWLDDAITVNRLHSSLISNQRVNLDQLQ